MISTRDLCHAYPGGAPLRFPDVEVPQGGVLLLRGPSGAGKSTWLALVAGLLRPAAGQLCVAGQDLTSLGARALDAWRGRTIGFLPQKLLLSPLLSVAENLALAYHARGLPVDRRAIEQALAALGVVSLQGRRPTQLSGGQAQRVALARALLHRPAVLLADEPTASLDDEAAAAALQALRQASRQHGATLVVASHDVRAACALQDAAVLALASVPVDENGLQRAPTLREQL